MLKINCNCMFLSVKMFIGSSQHYFKYRKNKKEVIVLIPQRILAEINGIPLHCKSTLLGKYFYYTLKNYLELIVYRVSLRKLNCFFSLLEHDTH